MSNSSLSSSPARSSISTTAIAGANVPSALTADDFNLPADLISIQDRKDEALQVLKSDLMAALNKEVKSLDEDSWMFDGPRSRINLISRPGGLHKRADFTKVRNFAPSR
ncbi:Hydroxymethylpyrimidine/phosphomethylpyrimidine kinase [Actinidia chinensis var. chinensis]|uniref:Hydroxymethylpyrimidine/phosphomethylpyrimidine kinase n=1 Tax=Actinidia chinensis var. chinensis TaxID=1590841 RepID=A0A2R6PIA9_ACTCC|nr:protein SAMBA-like [Actinidia eriantha]PSR91617.1 Hydroxymethylpyrimidine/phosphomethylpyrimidine kinase [Actinidia chinensis var. chinensis]